MKNYQERFIQQEGKYAIYRTGNEWVDKKEMLVKIKKAYKHFVHIVMVDHEGSELRNESCNYFSLLDGGDSLEMVEEVACEAS